MRYSQMYFETIIENDKGYLTLSIPMRFAMASADDSVRTSSGTLFYPYRWSRERAIRYYSSKTGEPRHRAEDDIDRFITVPGQALQYKVGHMKIEQLRYRAARRLGKWVLTLKLMLNPVWTRGRPIRVPIIYYNLLIERLISNGRRPMSGVKVRGQGRGPSQDGDQGRGYGRGQGAKVTR